MIDVRGNLLYVILGIVTANVVLYIFFHTSSPSSIISPLAEAKSIPLSSPTPTATPKPSGLKRIVEETFETIDGEYAVVIKNLKTQEFFQVNTDKTFEPASLYKLWIMATVFDQINNGSLTEDKILTESVSALNSAFNLDPELAELTEGTVQFTVENALTQMISISHNYAALLLGKTVRLKNVQQFLKNNGFQESTIGEPPQTTAHDVALFLEKIYENKLINEIYSAKMIELLKLQKLRNKIPKYLPKDALVGHKTGELGRFSHDAGIVFHPNGDYIIVILTESPIPTRTEERIANLSKKLYTYFSNNGDSVTN